MNTRLISSPRPQARQGSAVLVVVVLLSIMMLLITATMVSDRNLERELQHVEKNQLKRLAAHPANPTNTAAASPAHE